MGVKFSNQYQKLSLAQIRDTEKVCKLTFPEEYVNFLLKNNGGKPEPYTFTIDNGPKGRFYCLNKF